MPYAKRGPKSGDGPRRDGLHKHRLFHPLGSLKGIVDDHPYSMGIAAPSNAPPEQRPIGPRRSRSTDAQHKEAFRVQAKRLQGPVEGIYTPRP